MIFRPSEAEWKDLRLPSTIRWGLCKESGRLQHGNNLFPAGSQLGTCSQQVFGEHGIPIAASGIPEPANVEGLYESLNVRHERSIRLVRTLQ
jgi:hypothetical protein